MHFSRARLRGHRDGQKRSERAVAEAAGLACVDYELIEMGVQRPDEGQLEALAKALGVPSEDLLGSDDDQTYAQNYISIVLRYGAPMSDETIQRVAGVLRRPRTEVVS